MGKTQGEGSTRSARQSSATIAACKGKKRIRWTNELHTRFERAVADLGGAHYATPKGILERMNEPYVTIMHVKSHLQKYRLTLTAEQQATQKSEPRDPAFADVSMASEGRSGGEGSSPRAEVHAGTQSEPQDWCDRSAGEPASQEGSDEAARKKLVETIIQQHQMQKELRHQIQVQSELHKSLQDQHTLLQHHFQSYAAQQPMAFHGIAFHA